MSPSETKREQPTSRDFRKERSLGFMAGFLWVDVPPGEAGEGTVSSGRWDTSTHLVTEVRGSG